jgi:hypothetical protein
MKVSLATDSGVGAACASGQYLKDAHAIFSQSF